MTHFENVVLKAGILFNLKHLICSKEVFDMLIFESVSHLDRRTVDATSVRRT